MTIEIRNLCKSFKDVKAVQNVNLIVESGESVALLGPNGAGKTTLVEMIEGVQYPDSGEIHILDRSWEKDENFLRKQIGIALQETRFLERLTVEETLNLFASFYSLKKKRVREVIEIIQLESKRTKWVLHLSGGQRQRLALGVAILHSPEILILDEPTTGLDPIMTDSINRLIDKFHNNGNVTSIIVTHEMRTVYDVADRVVLINEGEIAYNGSPENIKKQENNIIRQFVIGDSTI